MVPDSAIISSTSLQHPEGKILLVDSTENCIRSSIPTEALTDARKYDIWNATTGNTTFAVAGPSWIPHPAVPHFPPAEGTFLSTRACGDFPKHTVSAFPLYDDTNNSVELSDGNGNDVMCKVTGIGSRDNFTLPLQDTVGIKVLNDSRPLRIYYQNVRGLRTKIDDFFPAVSDQDYDVVVLTETWLDKAIHSAQLFGEHYTVYRTDRNPGNSHKTRGGGVLVAVASHLASMRDRKSVV